MSRLEVIEASNTKQISDCLKIREEVFINEQGVPKEEELDELDNNIQDIAADEQQVLSEWEKTYTSVIKSIGKIHFSQFLSKKIILFRSFFSNLRDYVMIYAPYLS